MRIRKLIALLSATYLVGAACTSASSRGAFQGDTGDAGGSQPSGDGGAFGAGGGFNAVDGMGTSYAGGAAKDGKPSYTATVTGVVHAPEGTIPIPGAAVYLTKTSPDPLPQGVYCDACIHLTESQPYALTAADGSFTFKAPPGDWVVVVQKGSFRRARKVTLTEGAQALPGDVTRFPGHTDEANGDFIPKMIVTETAGWDHIDKTLQKLGIEQFDSFTASLAHIGQERGLLKSYDALSGYNIVFLPCVGPTTCDHDYGSLESDIQNNLRKFVASGGKLYATDYRYDYVKQIWKGFVEWDPGANADPNNSEQPPRAPDAVGYSCLLGSGDSGADVRDMGLKSWLDGLGFNAFNLYGSYTSISKTNAQVGLGPDGSQATITPRVWVGNAQNHPSTVSFEHGCGRVLFSTYHTEDSTVDASIARFAGLLPQELALLYIILQVDVCIGPDDTGVIAPPH